MLSGVELFAGAHREAGFGHLVVCGLGGVLVEVLDDTAACLTPVTEAEAARMIRRLKAYPLLGGYRGKPGVDEALFNSVLQRVSALLEAAPEIAEMDINPLIGAGNELKAVDARIRIEK